MIEGIDSFGKLPTPDDVDAYFEAERKKRQSIEEHQQQMRQKTDVRLKHSFDLAAYNRLKSGKCREIQLEDLKQVGTLYNQLLIDSDVFYQMYLGEFTDAERASDRGFIHRWKLNENEKEVWQKLRTGESQYCSPEEEFQNFLEGRHGRAADFRAWGIFDDSNKLLALASGFFPPKDPSRREKHGAQVRSFFETRRKGRRRFVKDPHAELRHLRKRSETTAEFFLIASAQPGGSTVITQHMIDQLHDEEVEISDMYLLRYGSMRMIYPEKDKRVAHDSPNADSRAYFRKRGFGDCGYFLDTREYACIEARAGVVVVVHPKWIVMHAEYPEVESGNATEFAHLESKAHEAMRIYPRH